MDRSKIKGLLILFFSCYLLASCFASRVGAEDVTTNNLISILAAVGVGAWAFFGVIERLNTLETDNTLIKKDLDQAVEFSIKWPRGELGSLPADSEQFLLIESLLSDVEYIQLEIKESRHNAVNILRLQKDVDKIIAVIEVLKDKVRNNGDTP